MSPLEIMRDICDAAILLDRLGKLDPESVRNIVTLVDTASACVGEYSITAEEFSAGVDLVLVCSNMMKKSRNRLNWGELKSMLGEYSGD